MIRRNVDLGDAASTVDHVARVLPQASGCKHLVIYAHGGLNSEEDSLKRVAAMGPYFQNNGIYPVFLTWKSGPLETIQDILQDTARPLGMPSQGIADRLSEAWDRTVEVAAAVTLLDTQTANRAVTLDQQAMLDLPTNARNPFQLVHVNAGVIAVRTGISQATQDQNHNRFSMNGGRGQAGLTLIDGVPASAVDWGGLIASPSVDSVQEMNIQRNQFDAQFGKSDGGAVNMITKGGSTSFHGSVYDFLRNNNLDANSWANNRSGIKRPSFQRNQFGGTFSGPIWKEKKLFFFTAYEGRREGNPSTTIQNVPTALQRNGDFSETRNAAGVLFPSTTPSPLFPTRTAPALCARRLPGIASPLRCSTRWR